MKFIIMFVLLFVYSNFSKNLQIISTINTKYKDITTFDVFYNVKNVRNIAVFSYNKILNTSFLEIFNQRNKVIFSKNLGVGSVMGINTVITRTKLFYFLNKLFILDVNDLQLDSVDLKNNDYTTLQISGDLLIMNTYKNIDIYSINTFKLLNTIKRKETIPWDLPKLQQDLITFKYLQNELQIFDYKRNKQIKRFNTGEKEVSLLGVKIGSMKDAITDYKIYNNFLYFVTLGGSIYKYDFGLKKNLISRKYFMGDENNAGLINNFWFTDANLDGIEDFVGAAVDNNIYCINGKDLSTLWQYNTGNENQDPIYLYDINADSIPEVFGVNYYDQKLFIIDGKTGKLLYDKILNDEGKWYPTSVFVDDRDNDGNIEIVCKSGLPNELIILELKR